MDPFVAGLLLGVGLVVTAEGVAIAIALGVVDRIIIERVTDPASLCVPGPRHLTQRGGNSDAGRGTGHTATSSPAAS